MWVKGKGAAAPLHGQGGCSHGTGVDGGCKEPRRRPHSGGAREESERWLARRRQPWGLSIAAALAAYKGGGRGNRGYSHGVRWRGARRPSVKMGQATGKVVGCTDGGPKAMVFFLTPSLVFSLCLSVFLGFGLFLVSD
ncbi:hypothetical protein SESBI_49586 [Sesbania bispinosa]|nr:hypothetical protein SESBI_49586 [Sesbania bispinosa]